MSKVLDLGKKKKKKFWILGWPSSEESVLITVLHHFQQDVSLFPSRYTLS